MTSWSPELLEQAKTLCESGQYSFGEVAAMIGHGKTRNAVISRAHDYGWKVPRTRPPTKGINARPSGRGTATSNLEHRIKTRLAFDHLFKSLEEPPEPAEFLGLTFDELDREKGRRDCRYPRGDKPYLFCGQPAKEGSSYCPSCHALCFVKPKNFSDEDRERRRTHIRRTSYPTVHTKNSQWENLE